MMPNCKCASCVPLEPYTLEKALDLARDLIFGPLPPPNAPTPTLKEAEIVLADRLQTCGFNWITGQNALKLVRTAKISKKSS